MSKNFYSSEAYRAKQSLRTKLNWQKGIHDFLIKRVVRKCLRKDCDKTFQVPPSDPKKYCSQRCSALVNNPGRVMLPATKDKISRALIGRTYPERQGITYIELVCQNHECRKIFKREVWEKSRAKYCSNRCAMKVIGGKPTSPKAARAKAGVRADIDPEIYFYSRWEANYARILNLEGIKWIHQPKRFKLLNQFYTPDFYLPEQATYVEIKNFLAPYSQKRDEQFRQLYPKEKLVLILKEDYKKLESKYSSLIENWEFNNS